MLFSLIRKITSHIGKLQGISKLLNNVFCNQHIDSGYKAGIHNSNLMARHKIFVYMLNGQNLNVFTLLKVVFRE